MCEGWGLVCVCVCVCEKGESDKGGRGVLKEESVEKGQV